MSETYTDRTIEVRTVTKIDVHEDGSASVTDDSGWSHYAPKEVADRLDVGSVYIMETKGFNTIGGWFIGEWMERKSDEHFEEQRLKSIEDFARRNREALEANREKWTEQEAALPQWLRDRLVTFHERGGEAFELEGWGYELIVARLAVLYVESEGQESPAIDEIARTEGTSGNQHGMARAIAMAHLADQDRSMAQTVSALAPLSGKPFYEKED